jgi:hypothetical protein
MNHRFAVITALVITALLFSPSAWAWGRIAHRAASMLAEERLTPHALSVVHDLLGPDVSLADVSTTADNLKWAIKGNRAWHFAYVPITESRYAPRFCDPGGCLVSKIRDFERVLKDSNATKAEKQEALISLVHFIEDLHQPLHVGDTGSQGGKLIQVRFFKLPSNLHRVWDSQIIERYTPDEQELLGGLKHITTPALAAQWSKGTIEEWATESLQVAKQAYFLPGTSTIMTSGTEIDAYYCSIALPIIQAQLAKAGVRVAWMLNQIFR